MGDVRQVFARHAEQVGLVVVAGSQHHGARAAGVLARGCAIDFALNAFGPNACARTRLAQLPVVVRRVTAERFECVVDRSAAQYVFDWMQDAAAGLD